MYDLPGHMADIVLTHFPASAHAFFLPALPFPLNSRQCFPSRTSSNAIFSKRPSSIPLARGGSVSSVLPCNSVLPVSNGPHPGHGLLVGSDSLATLCGELLANEAYAVSPTDTVSAAQDDTLCFYKMKWNRTFRSPVFLYLSSSGIFRKIRSKNSTASLWAEMTTT